MYRLIRFGTFSISWYNQVDDVGSGRVANGYMALPEGGALDLYGSRRTHPGIVERIKSARIQGVSQSAAESIYLQTLALRGQRDKLYRQTVSGEIQWMYARLVEVRAVRSYELTPFQTLQDVELTFATQEATWRGDYRGGWNLDDTGIYLDSGYELDSEEEYLLNSTTKELTVTVGAAGDAGRAPVRAVRLTVTAGTSDITALGIERANGEKIEYEATLAMGESLVIDSGTMQVTATDNTDAYDDIEFSALTDLAAWFSLEAGANVITVTRTGGPGSTIEFSFYEAWY